MLKKRTQTNKQELNDNSHDDRFLKKHYASSILINFNQKKMYIKLILQHHHQDVKVHLIRKQ